MLQDFDGVNTGDTLAGEGVSVYAYNETPFMLAVGKAQEMAGSVRRIWFLWLVAFVTILPAGVVAQEPDGAGDYGDSEVIHVVQKGDWLSTIGQRYGVSWIAIAQLNGITDPDKIEVGQRLIIPVEAQIAGVEPSLPEAAEQVTAPDEEALADVPAKDAQTTEESSAAETEENDAAPVVHVVQRGETLGIISKKYGVTWVAISAWNKLQNPDRIEIGDRLEIPDADWTPPPSYSPPKPTPVPPTVPSEALPPPVVSDPHPERYILVELSKQQITAFENGQVVRQTLVSTGLPGTPTVVGDYYIYIKLTSQTMYGPGYYLPDVPYVMYFYRGYGIHGTYWHDKFGQPMSHGCVNLPTPEAEWFFSFASIGTLVRVVA